MCEKVKNEKKIRKVWNKRIKDAKANTWIRGD